MDFDPLQVPLQALNASASPVHHILTGSFRSISLFLLAFSPLRLTLDLVQTIPAFGPHQYIGLGPRREDGDVRHAYTTSWALPPQLQSWAIEQQPDGLRVRFVDSVDITATSSYITVPPPYSHIYSSGGPSAQVHALNNSTGFGPHVQEIYFVPQSEWAAADKTRKALVCVHLPDGTLDLNINILQRYGSHGIEFAFPAGSPALAFIPVLGGSTIEVYTRAEDGSLTHIDTSPAPVRAGVAGGAEEEDGPRHVKVHPNGRVLYCVTEHSNYLDMYTITPPNGMTPVLTYVTSRSLIPPHLRSSAADAPVFRGDTLLLSPSTPSHPAPQSIFATTRGGEGSATRGWVSVWRLDAEGMFFGADTEGNPYLVERFWASTTGGKAHALDIVPKSTEDGGADGAMWVLLTDDDVDDAGAGVGIRVLEWDGWLWRGGGTRLREVAVWPPAGFYDSKDEIAKEGEDESGKEVNVSAKEGAPERMIGASHAVWLD